MVLCEKFYVHSGFITTPADLKVLIDISDSCEVRSLSADGIFVIKDYKSDTCRAKYLEALYEKLSHRSGKVAFRITSETNMRPFLKRYFDFDVHRMVCVDGDWYEYQYSDY